MLFRHLIPILVLAVASLTGPASAQRSTTQDVGPAISPVDRAMARGDEAYARLDNQAAVAAYDEALSLATAPYSFDLLARVARALNDYGLDLVAADLDDEGERVLTRATELSEELTRRFAMRAESWFLLAASYGNLSLYKGGREKVRLGRAVEQHCLEAIRVDPGFSPPYAVLGIFYREVAELNWLEKTVANTLFGGIPTGSYRLSEEMLRKAVSLEPVMPLAHFELGKTLMRAGKPDDAKPFLTQAITMRPISTLDVRNAQEARRLLGRG